MNKGNKPKPAYYSFCAGRGTNYHRTLEAAERAAKRSASAQKRQFGGGLPAHGFGLVADLRSEAKARKRNPMFRMDEGSWQAGFEAGKQGKPNKPPVNMDSLSFRSGYIEGKAGRTKARKRNPLGIPLPTPQGIALHLVGSKLLRKKNPGYTQHGATEDLFGGASRATPRHHSDVSRPRVKVHGGTVTFAEGSPYKGKVRKANPVPKVVRKPLVLVLTQAESKAINGRGPTVAMVRKAFAAAKESGKAGWDHIVVEHPGGAGAFTLIP